MPGYQRGKGGFSSLQRGKGRFAPMGRKKGEMEGEGNLSNLLFTFILFGEAVVCLSESSLGPWHE